jgi:CBS domain containing-hemolysin-like protein
MMSTLERIPKVGDEVPVAGGVLTVATMTGRRMERIRFTPVAAPAEGGDA